MYLKKTQSGDVPDDVAEIALMVEPRPGFSDEEVVARLREAGASEVTVLAPGFISARARRAVVQAMEAVAFVHLKAMKQPRGLAL